MSSIVWLHNKDAHHTWGIEVMSTDKYTVENFVLNQVIGLCKEIGISYFVQGCEISEFRTTKWAFVEFLGEGDQDKILAFLTEFEKRYCKYCYHDRKIFFEEPSKELLEDLGLF